MQDNPQRGGDSGPNGPKTSMTKTARVLDALTLLMFTPSARARTIDVSDDQCGSVAGAISGISRAVLSRGSS
jgi:hypothetical protein